MATCSQIQLNKIAFPVKFIAIAMSRKKGDLHQVAFKVACSGFNNFFLEMHKSLCYNNSSMGKSNIENKTGFQLVSRTFGTRSGILNWYFSMLLSRSN